MRIWGQDESNEKSKRPGHTNKTIGVVDPWLDPCYGPGLIRYQLGDRCLNKMMHHFDMIWGLLLIDVNARGKVWSFQLETVTGEAAGSTIRHLSRLCILFSRTEARR